MNMESSLLKAATLVLSIVLGATTVLADNPSRAEALADACTSCHGFNGRGQGSIPPLTTTSRIQFVQAMTAFREQKRAATVMNRIARAYTPTEVELMADFFSARANP